MPLSRRSFIKTGLIWAPTIFNAGPMWGAVRYGNMDPQVGGWLKRLRDASTGANGVAVVANDVFMKIVRSNGLRSLIYRANTYTGFDLTACLQPLINDRGTTSDTNGAMATTDYDQSTGLTGTGNPGARKFVNPGFLPSTEWASADNLHIGAYSRTDSNESNNSLLGAVVSGQAASSIYLTVRISLASNTSYTLLTGGNLAQTGAADPDTLGFYLASRVSSSSLVLYKNGASIASNGGASGNLQAPGLYVHAVNDSLLGDQINTAKALGGYTIGLGMTATEAAAYSYAWKRLQTILGRQVV